MGIFVHVPAHNENTHFLVYIFIPTSFLKSESRGENDRKKFFGISKIIKAGFKLYDASIREDAPVS